MIGRMHESYPQRVPGGDAVEHVLHEVPASCAILHGGSNRTRAEAGNRRAFVEEVAANNAPIQLRHNCIHPWMRQPCHHAFYGDFRRRVAGGKVMLLGNGFESLVADGATHSRVLRPAWAKYEWHRVLSLW